MSVIHVLPIIKDGKPHAILVHRDQDSIDSYLAGEFGEISENLHAHFREQAENANIYGCVLVDENGQDVDSLWGIDEDSSAKAAVFYARYYVE